MATEQAPRVSVIVATYNSAPLLRHALASIRLQDLADFEVWVVGDGCTDDSAAVVAQLADPRFHWHNLASNHRAPHAAHAYGIAQARGGYIAYLNHDDLWMPWHLSTLLDVAERDNRAFVYDGMAILDPGTPAFYRGELDLAGAAFGQPSAWLHRREIVGTRLQWRSPYDVGRATDTDFLLQAAAQGHRPTYVHRLGGLKFGSSAWGYYGGGQAPLAEYQSRIESDPEGLAAELGHEALGRLSLALQRAERPATSVAARQLVQALIRALIDRLGALPALQGALRRWLFKRQRRRNNRARGLPF